MSETKLDTNYFKSLREKAEKRDLEAKRTLKEAVKNGNIEAMYEYGNLMAYNNNYNEWQKAERYYRMAANKGHRKSMEKLIDTHFKILELAVKKGYTIDMSSSLIETLVLCKKYEDSDLRDKIINFYDKMGKFYSEAKKRYEEITAGTSTNKQEVKTTPNIQKPKQIPNEVFKKPDPFINKQMEEESKNEYSEIKKLADKGDGDAIEAYFNLIYNEEVSVDEEEKLKYYKMAADMGIIDTNDKFICDYANILYDNYEYKKAFEYFKKAADRGNEHAIRECFELIKNNEIDVNEKEKIEYYKMAINVGNDIAINEYLNLILKGEIENISNKERVEYIQMAADKGNVRAAYEYGLILYNGLYDVTINKEEANDFLKFAADMGIVDTDGKFAYNYANILYKDNKIDEALKYFKKAANRGNKKALEEYNSISDEKRIIECFKIMQKGAEEVKYLADKGNIEAMYELGNYYRFIEKVREEKEEKVKTEEKKEETKREKEEAKQEKEKYYKMAADRGYEKATIKFKNDSLSEKINRFEEIRDNLVKYNCNIVLYDSTREGMLHLFERYMNFLKCNPELGGLNFIPGENPALEQLIDEEVKRITGDNEYNKIYSKATEGMSGSKTIESNKISYKELIKVECFKNLINRIFDEITKNIESYKNLDEATIIGKVTEKIGKELMEENKREKTDEEKIEFLEERNKFLEVLFKKSLSKGIYRAVNPSEEEVQKEKESENKNFEDKKNDMKKRGKSYRENLLKYSYKEYKNIPMLVIIINEEEIEQLKEKLKNKNKPVTERVEELKREVKGTKQEHTTNEAVQRKTKSKIFKRIIIDFGDKTQGKGGVGQGNGYPG